MILVVHPGSRIQGSKGHRIPRNTYKSYMHLKYFLDFSGKYGNLFLCKRVQHKYIYRHKKFFQDSLLFILKKSSWQLSEF
jgi:hypothetical protein